MLLQQARVGERTTYQDNPLRMSQVLFDTKHEGFGSLVNLPSNSNAVESALLFSAGLHEFVCLLGPTGWGKSHILRATAHAVKRETGVKIPIETTGAWVETLARSDSPLPLFLDDAQIALSNTRIRQRLRMVLERRIRGRKPVILAFTSDGQSRLLKSLLPNSQKWHISSIKLPTGSEKVALVQAVAKTQGLKLPDPLVRLISKRLVLTGGSLVGALQRLALVQTDWTSSCGILRACGVLDPLFCGEAAWDLRDHTHEVLFKALEQFSPDVNREEFILYMMHQILGITEEQIAGYFGISSCRVYGLSNQITARVTSGELLELRQMCCRSLVQSFTSSA
ncbi:MAG: hypothetical protein K8R88_12105 [Armatimonadetes bacterium]|nr:hypothetical protein [Armatimonadota bacterium]